MIQYSSLDDAWNIKKVYKNNIDLSTSSITSTIGTPIVTSNVTPVVSPIVTPDKPSISVISDKPSVNVTSDKPSVSVTSDKPSVSVTSDKPSVSVTPAITPVSNIEEFSHSDSHKECENYLDHISSCTICKNKLKNILKPDTMILNFFGNKFNININIAKFLYLLFCIIILIILFNCFQKPQYIPQMPNNMYSMY
jgi:hypothetical protein